MPIDVNKIAKTTAFGQNCALNALSHVLIKHILEEDGKGGAAGGRVNLIPHFNELLRAFKQYYKLPWKFKAPDLVQVLKNTENPAHREILLGPVLRTMLLNNRLKKPNTPLFATNIYPLANKFGISVQSYNDFPGDKDFNKDTLNGKGMLKPQNGPILKIIHNGNNHWEYEESTPKLAKSHNQYYPCTNQKEVAETLEKIFYKKNWGNIKQVLAPLSQVGNATLVTDPNSLMSLIETGIQKIFSGFDKKDPLIQGLSGFFGLIFKLFFGIAVMGKQLGKALDAGAELDEEDFAKNPQGNGPQFKHKVSKVTQNNPALAKSLNRAWRADGSPKKESAHAQLKEVEKDVNLSKEEIRTLSGEQRAQAIRFQHNVSKIAENNPSRAESIIRAWRNDASPSKQVAFGLLRPEIEKQKAAPREQKPGKK
jgi:hypothetical protein